jgi:hypothetical protein
MKVILQALYRMSDLDRELLKAASIKNNESALSDLLSKGANVNAVDPDDGSTALHFASMCPVTLRPNMIRVLLNKGANPNIQNMSGMTPLMYAVNCGDTFPSENMREPGAAVKALLCEDSEIKSCTSANLDLTDMHGQNALYLAIDKLGSNDINAISSNISTIRTLIKKGAAQYLKITDTRFNNGNPTTIHILDLVRMNTGGEGSPLENDIKASIAAAPPQTDPRTPNTKVKAPSVDCHNIDKDENGNCPPGENAVGGYLRGRFARAAKKTRRRRGTKRRKVTRGKNRR